MFVGTTQSFAKWMGLFLTLFLPVEGVATARLPLWCSDLLREPQPKSYSLILWPAADARSFLRIQDQVSTIASANGLEPWDHRVTTELINATPDLLASDFRDVPSRQRRDFAMRLIVSAARLEAEILYLSLADYFAEGKSMPIGWSRGVEEDARLMRSLAGKEDSGLKVSRCLDLAKAYRRLADIYKPYPDAPLDQLWKANFALCLFIKSEEMSAHASSNYSGPFQTNDHRFHLFLPSSVYFESKNSARLLFGDEFVAEPIAQKIKVGEWKGIFLFLMPYALAQTQHLRALGFDTDYSDRVHGDFMSFWRYQKKFTARTKSASPM